jgi:hypothetical protein
MMAWLIKVVEFGSFALPRRVNLFQGKAKVESKSRTGEKI